jgi:hypothetical protein
VQFTVASYSWFGSLENWHGETNREKNEDWWLYRAENRVARVR